MGSKIGDSGVPTGSVKPGVGMSLKGSSAQTPVTPGGGILRVNFSEQVE
jgi:hypothetical protein